MSALNLPLLQGAQGPTGPYAPRHFVKATRTAAFSFSATANTYAKMDYSTEESDIEALYVSGTYTCPEAGIYSVAATVSIAGSGAASMVIQGRKNGTMVGNVNWWCPSTSAMIANYSDMILCAAGDTLEIWCSTSIASAGIRTTANENRLAICYLGTA